MPFDVYFQKQAKIPMFYPRTLNPPRSDDVDLLFRCTTFLAVGVSLSQFGKIMRLCDDCDRYVFVESIEKHNCGRRPYNVKAKNFSITLAIYCYGCPGIKVEDLEVAFLVCDTCRRVYLKKFSSMHNCLGLGGDGSDADA